MRLRALTGYWMGVAVGFAGAARLLATAPAAPLVLLFTGVALFALVLFLCDLLASRRP